MYRKLNLSVLYNGDLLINILRSILCITSVGCALCTSDTGAATALNSAAGNCAKFCCWQPLRSQLMTQESIRLEARTDCCSCVPPSTQSINSHPSLNFQHSMHNCHVNNQIIPVSFGCFCSHYLQFSWHWQHVDISWGISLGTSRSSKQNVIASIAVY
jgi:hypothetical protein